MDLENATLVELRQLAKEQGVKNVSKLKKEELLEILESSKKDEIKTEETEELEEENYQGNAVVNYTEYEVPYTRIIEHKHFEYGPSLGKVAEGEAAKKTIITREYPDKWVQGKEPYYTMNDEKNTKLYAKYKELADRDNKVIFGGRLGQYKYFDMDKVIVEALNISRKELE